MKQIYVLVRLDLPLAQQVVQAAHAANEIGKIEGNCDTKSLILCGIESEKALLLEKEKLQDFPHVLFREPDIGDEATALAVIPPQKKLCRHLKLWQPP